MTISDQVCAHFNLEAAPFSIAPDPRFLYLSDSHREGLAHLLFGLEREGGMIVLTGEVGTGKTTLCRYFLEHLPDDVRLAFVVHPRLTALELLGTLCEEFGLNVTGDGVKARVDAIHAFLLAQHGQGQRLAVLIDEAQNLSADVLEQLRLLTNLETHTRKLLQVILLGQPELRELLAQPSLRQFSQRITARYHLNALSAEEVVAYVHYRLQVVGGKRDLFEESALRRIAQLSRGIPRLINLLADRCLVGAYGSGVTRIDAAMVRQAAEEMEIGDAARSGPESGHRYLGYSQAILGGVLVLFMVWGGWIMGSSFWPALQAQPATAATEVTAAAPAGDTDPVIEAGTAADEMAVASLPESVAQPAVVSDFLENHEVAAGDSYRAWRALVQAWNPAPIPPGTQSLCEYAESLGLRCLYRQGNWQELLLLDRPAMLVLEPPGKEALSVALLGIDTRGQARIHDGQSARLVSVEHLALHWQGEYALLYKLPPFQSLRIIPGQLRDRGAWLTRELDRLSARWLRLETAAGPPPPPTNASLETKVRWFQGVAGLEQDGVVGPLTLIGLNNFNESGVPRLQERDS